ncbi:MAG: T9SS type A sorting domain-containing protein, partial [Bacteroidota bacterium]
SGYEGEGGANRDDALAGTTPNAHIRIQAFPNPFEQATTLQLDLPRSGTYDVALFDVLGRQVRAWTLDEPAGTTATLALTLAGTAAGTYMVRVRHRESGAMATRRVLQVR